MIRATRIGHVHLNVRDLDRAERFYTEILGFQVQERIPGKFVFLALGKRHHDLALRFIGAGAPVPPELSVGMYHFAVEVEDMASLARVLRRLKNAGVPVEGIKPRGKPGPLLPRSGGYRGGVLCRHPESEGRIPDVTIRPAGRRSPPRPSRGNEQVNKNPCHFLSESNTS